MSAASLANALSTWAAEGGLDLGRVERVQEGAQRVDRWGAAEAGAEGHIQPLAMHGDEDPHAAVGGGAGQDRQYREQQQVGEAVALALAAAGVGDLLQGGEQAGERHHGGLRCEGFGPQRPRRADGLAAANLALTDRSCPEPNSPARHWRSSGISPDVPRQALCKNRRPSGRARAHSEPSLTAIMPVIDTIASTPDL